MLKCLSENRLNLLLVLFRKCRHKTMNILIERSSVLFFSFTKWRSARIFCDNALATFQQFTEQKKHTNESANIKHWFRMDLLGFLLRNVLSDIQRVCTNRKLSDKARPSSLITLGFSWNPFLTHIHYTNIYSLTLALDLLFLVENETLTTEYRAYDFVLKMT